MGPRDRHSILRFLAFCQNNILCAAIFSESELGADVAPEQLHVGEGRQDAQNKDGCFRRDGRPGKESRGPVLQADGQQGESECGVCKEE